MTDERLAANAKDALDSINHKLTKVDSEWEYNMRVLISEMRGYAATLEKSMKDSDKYAAYRHIIDCKHCILNANDTLRRLFNDVCSMRAFLAILNNEGEKND